MTLKEYLNLVNLAPSIEEFAKENKLKISSKDGVFILNYDEEGLETPKNWISHYSRGITLKGEPKNYKIVAKSFDRFYNVGEAIDYLGGLDDIDYNKPFEVQFKYDGSLIIAYIEDGALQVQTRGSFADGKPSEICDKTWRSLFLDNLGNTQLSANTTHIYELCTPYNQVVDYYEKPFVVKLGEVNLDGTENKDTFEGDKYRCSSFEEVTALLNTLKPSQEGFVIAQWDEARQKYKRKKYKTKTWVELSHFKDSDYSSVRRLLEIVFKNETAEVVAVFPHLKDKFEKIQKVYEQITAEIMEEYEKIKDIENQKEFALANTSKYKGLLFALRAKNKNIKQLTQEYLIKNYDQEELV
jgi:hypothetical protein